jgi:hypothetical protein
LIYFQTENSHVDDGCVKNSPDAVLHRIPMDLRELPEKLYEIVIGDPLKIPALR